MLVSFGASVRKHENRILSWWSDQVARNCNIIKWSGESFDLSKSQRNSSFWLLCANHFSSKIKYKKREEFCIFENYIACCWWSIDWWRPDFCIFFNLPIHSRNLPTIIWATLSFDPNVRILFFVKEIPCLPLIRHCRVTSYFVVKEASFFSPRMFTTFTASFSIPDNKSQVTRGSNRLHHYSDTKCQ